MSCSFAASNPITMSQYFVFKPAEVHPGTGEPLEGKFIRIATYDAKLATEIFKSRYGKVEALQFCYDGFDSMEVILNKTELETLILTSTGVCSILNGNGIQSHILSSKN